VVRAARWRATRSGTRAERATAGVCTVPLRAPLPPGAEAKIVSVLRWTQLDDTQQGKVAQTTPTFTAADVSGA
jgi:hypothetical protein